VRIQNMAIRSMTEAKYICSGSPNSSLLSHYGLRLKYYTHFTSPIRRYTDVIVNILLLASLHEQGVKDYDEPSNLVHDNKTRCYNILVKIVLITKTLLSFKIAFLFIFSSTFVKMTNEKSV